jgi:hypothetical protein
MAGLVGEKSGVRRFERARRNDKEFPGANLDLKAHVGVLGSLAERDRSSFCSGGLRPPDASSRDVDLPGCHLQRKRLPEKRPLLSVSDKPCPDRILPDVIPFLCVGFITAEHMVEESFLPMGSWSAQELEFFGKRILKHSHPVAQTGGVGILKSLEGPARAKRSRQLWTCMFARIFCRFCVHAVTK